MSRTNKELSDHSVLTQEVLHGMSRTELRKVAKAANVPTGRNKWNTVANLSDAIWQKKLHLKAVVTIAKPSANAHIRGNTVFVKKLRTYKPDRVIVPVITPPIFG